MKLDEASLRSLELAFGDNADAFNCDAVRNVQRLHPRDADAVAAAVRWANAYHQRLCPTSSGRVGARADAILLDLAGLNGVLEVHQTDMLAVVQAGVLVRELGAAAEAIGLAYPPAFLASPTERIGSALARGAGARSRLAGPHRDYALGLRVVMGTGDQALVGSRAIKNQTGYSLTQTLIGSWGALAVVVDATLRLVPAATAHRTCVAEFPSLGAAIEAAVGLGTSAVAPACVELLDAHTLAALGGASAARGANQSLLLVLLTGPTAGELDMRAESAAGALRRAGAVLAEVAAEPDAAALWDDRRQAPDRLTGGPTRPVRLTLALPLDDVAHTLTRAVSLLAERGFEPACFGGVGGGAAELVLRSRPASADLLGTVREVVRLVHLGGGSVSGCTGLGIDYDAWLELLMPAANATMMRQVRRAVDPNAVLSPHLA